MHHSFAWCFFFYLSFLFPPVEPGVFNCCETIKASGITEIMPPVFCYALLSYKLRNIQTLVYAPVGGRYIFPEVNEYRVCFSFKFIALHTVDFA